MEGSYLFHSEIVEGKKENVLHLKWECCVHFLKYEMSAGQKLNGRSIGDARFYKLYKKYKVFYINVLNLVLDIVSLWTNP